ncbi:MAG: hypothetical protein QM608_08115 [Caulobacter sp.]
MAAPAADDLSLLAAHYSETLDGEMARIIVDGLGDDARAWFAERTRRLSPRAAATLLHQYVRKHDPRHPFRWDARSAFVAALANDMRPIENGRLRLSASPGHGFTAGMTVVLASLDQPLDVWRLCVVETAAPRLVMFKILVEHKQPLSVRHLEASALAVGWRGDPERLLKSLKLPVDEEPQSLLKEPSFAKGLDRKSAWKTHTAPANETFETKTGEVLRVSTKIERPFIAAFHQVVDRYRAIGGFHYGAQFRSLKNTANVALRLVALTPEGEVVLDAFNFNLPPSETWLPLRRTVLHDYAGKVRFEMGVLNLRAGGAVEITAPFLETRATVTRRNPAQGE